MLPISRAHRGNSPPATLPARSDGTGRAQGATFGPWPWGAATFARSPSSKGEAMCDTFCRRTETGMLFAKSSDRPFDEAQLVRWFGRRNSGTSLSTTHTSIPDSGAFSLLGSQPTWMWGLEHGVNEHRVAIGNEKIWTVDDPHQAAPALVGMDLVRLGLERSTTADMAVDVITSLVEKHGQGGSGEEHQDEPYWSSFLVVDGSGGWVVETSARSWVAKPVGDGAAISNRVTLSSDWHKASPDMTPGTNWDRYRSPDAPTGIADHRLAATRACIARGPGTSAREVAATLRDHGSGPWGEPGKSSSPEPVPQDINDDWSGVTVCMHIRDYQCTTASMIADVPSDAETPLRSWASVGTPCTSVLLPVAIVGAPDSEPVAVIPSVLGDQGAWNGFAALSRAAEKHGNEGLDALGEIRSVLDPIEASAWSHADELWASTAGSDSWNAASSEWDRLVRQALFLLSGI